MGEIPQKGTSHLNKIFNYEVEEEAQTVYKRPNLLWRKIFLYSIMFSTLGLAN